MLCITASALSPDPKTETQVLAANPDTEPVDESLLKQLIGIDGSQTLEVILIVTILSIAPSFLVMLTSFTRIVIVFSFLRNAMQTQSIPPNAVLMGLSLFLTVFIMWPTITDINENAYQPYSAGEIGINEMIDRSADSLKTFMLKNTSKSNMKFFLDLKGTVVYEAEQRSEAAAETEENSDFITPLEPLEPITDITERTPVDIEQTPNELTDYTDQLGLETVIPAFILSELTRAFQMGFLIFIPFLVIDIVVSSTLMAMGMMMLPPSMISLPFKIMLFVLVDGWQMLIGTLVNSFNI
ncbi:MAG: EscR/YscR/HrcR family type III secretion system export apparatus protein [Ruminiclostridium sp.]|nr:EscR/YscR/HrcR family type III secretion system export apparatus protein [Ruminiclostridium sp.]